MAKDITGREIGIQDRVKDVRMPGYTGAVIAVSDRFNDATILWEGQYIADEGVNPASLRVTHKATITLTPVDDVRECAGCEDDENAPHAADCKGMKA